MYCIKHYNYMLTNLCFYLGMSGTMYSDLSVNSHTIDVRFTPAGSMTSATLQLSFDIGNFYCKFATIDCWFSLFTILVRKIESLLIIDYT